MDKEVVSWSSSSAADAAIEPENPGEPSASAEERSATIDRRSMRSANLPTRPFSSVALAVTFGSLGFGLEAATPLTPKLNLRVGGTYATYSYPFNVDGVNYDSGLKFGSGQATLDWFPRAGGFHISPGILYFKSRGSATATTQPGILFELASDSYISEAADPLHGSANFRYARRVAPVLLVGFGNLLPRSGRHFSVPFEAGVAYMGRPKIAVQFAGTACATDGCFNAATDPDFQSNLQDQVRSLNDDIEPLKFYPILSIGLGYRF